MSSDTKWIVLVGDTRDGMRAEVSKGLSEIRVAHVPDEKVTTGDEKPPFHHVDIKTQTYHSTGRYDTDGSEIFALN